MPPDGVPEPGWLGPLRWAARTSLVAGAVFGVGWFIGASGQTPPFLRLLLALWVAGPAVVGALADFISKRWSMGARSVLYGLIVFLVGIAMVLYGSGWRPAGSAQGFTFVVVPGASMLVVAAVVLVSELEAWKRRRDDV
jgi:hypothetical protein